MWVFGYGSLIWKVDFPFEEKLVGFIKGFSRRFWQGSEDHRGFPGKPGRVVTLVASSDENEKVWGVAYRIKQSDVNGVRSHLDYREKGGYERRNVKFSPDPPDPDSGIIHLTVYVGTENNPHYLGPAPLREMASQIFYCVGPSGSNKEYLFNLAESLRTISPNALDTHISILEKEVLALETKCTSGNKGNRSS